MFGVDSKGTELNIQFAIENDLMTDIGSFHSGKPSKLFIEAKYVELQNRVLQNISSTATQYPNCFLLSPIRVMSFLLKILQQFGLVLFLF